MSEDLRNLQRRMNDLRAAADKIELAARNAMTLVGLRFAIANVVQGLRDRAKTLHEVAEDLIDQAAAEKSATKKAITAADKKLNASKR